MSDGPETDKKKNASSSSQRKRTWLTRNWTEDDFKEVEYTRQWNKDFSNAPFYILGAFVIFLVWYEVLR